MVSSGDGRRIQWIEKIRPAQLRNVTRTKVGIRPLQNSSAHTQFFLTKEMEGENDRKKGGLVEDAHPAGTEGRETSVIVVTGQFKTFFFPWRRKDPVFLPLSRSI